MTINVIWLQSGGCGGCSMSLLCHDTPDFANDLQSAGVHLLWHPTLSLQSGSDAIDIFERVLKKEIELDVLCIEGAVLRGPNNTGRFHMMAGTNQSMMEWISQLSHVARHVVAIGSCAAWGGFSALGNNTTQATGLQYQNDTAGGHLGKDFVAAGGLPVINVAGCPTHPGWVTETLFALAGNEMNPGDLDSFHRPRFYADQLVHHGCTRNEYYEFKASAEKPTDLGCLMENLGCKGTQAHADCNIRLWNGDGSCTRAGYACISCTEPGFQKPGHSYDSTPKIAGIPVGLPTDMPKAWFVALASLSKSATPRRVKQNAVSDHLVHPPVARKTGRR